MESLVLDQEVNEKFAIYNADCLDLLPSLADKSVDLSVFSPPFVDLFCYSSSERDFGNAATYDKFFVMFDALAAQLARVMKSGRNVAVHCIDIPAMKERDGYIGLKDFPGDIIRSFQKAGFIYHSRTTIWKDPLIEATRTKAIGLMHKQLCKDSIMSRCGLPDYLLAFRAPGDNETPITHKDEKHLCPLQLHTIARAVELWSNPGETVLTPFMGVGSEVYQAVAMGRRGIGCELKPSYYRQAVKNCACASERREEEDMPLFNQADEAGEVME